MTSWFKAKWQGVKDWYNHQDTQQGIAVATGLASDAFKVVMASMLAVFIPQACNYPESLRSIFDATFPGDSVPPELAGQMNGTMTTTHICTFQENFSNLIDYNNL